MVGMVKTREQRIVRINELFPCSLRDTSLTSFVILAAAGICFLLRRIDHKDAYTPMLFILAAFLISCFTNGYLYGIIASMAGMFAVNFISAYPNQVFSFTPIGYATTLCSLIVCIIAGILTSRMKQQEQMRMKAEKEGMRANLLRAISHDIRTPLTSILGANSTIIENDDILAKKERMDLRRGINEDAQWLIRMVENLLAITRMDAGDGASIIKHSEAVEELVSEAVSKFYKRFPEQGISVSVPETLLMVPMDAMLIQQVIINLLENAVLHSGGATRIAVTVYKRGSEAVFEVIDNGCGIAENTKQHIFEGYSNGSCGQENDRKRNMGIGLSVCYTIIRAHNGAMSAHNSDGGGAVFRFTLPLEEGDV
ncbi:MAG: ATP-binding protein [Clostridia bacterium]